MDVRIPSLLRIKPNALYKLGKYLRKNGFHRVAVFYGEGMVDLVGRNVAISLDSSEIDVVSERTVHGNDVSDVLTAAFALPRSVSAIVAIGGGIAIDVGKYAGFLTRLPVIAVPTAISNDGFCSPGASLRMEGPADQLPSMIPFGVVIDTTVISNSPQRFTYSGIGDLVSKFSAVADWKLAYHETGELINDFSVMISLQSVENLVNHPDKALDDLHFLQLVCGALVMRGVAMEVAGSSRPASGSEWTAWTSCLPGRSGRSRPTPTSWATPRPAVTSSTKPHSCLRHCGCGPRTSTEPITRFATSSSTATSSRCTTWPRSCEHCKRATERPPAGPSRGSPTGPPVSGWPSPPTPYGRCDPADSPVSDRLGVLTGSPAVRAPRRHRAAPAQPARPPPQS